jgi:hypothetical protein
MHHLRRCTPRTGSAPTRGPKAAARCLCIFGRRRPAAAARRKPSPTTDPLQSPRCPPAGAPRQPPPLRKDRATVTPRRHGHKGGQTDTQGWSAASRWSARSQGGWAGTTHSHRQSQGGWAGMTHAHRPTEGQKSMVQDTSSRPIHMDAQAEKGKASAPILCANGPMPKQLDRCTLLPGRPCLGTLHQWNDAGAARQMHLLPGQPCLGTLHQSNDAGAARQMHLLPGRPCLGLCEARRRPPPVAMP